jgi:hypothetical protein
MAEGCQRERWAHTSAQMALIANVNRDPKKRSAFQPADFNPFIKQKRLPITMTGVRILKTVFVDNRPGTP